MPEISVIPLVAPRRSKIAWMGDSYVGRESASSSSVIQTSPNGMIMNLAMLAKQPFSYDPIASNFGVSGATTTQLLAMVSSVIAYKPDIIFVQGGHNDWLVGTPMSTTIANKIAIFQALQAAGILVVALNEYTANTNQSSTFVTLSQYRSMIIYHNQWLRNYASTHRLLVWDVYSPTVDLTSSLGQLNTNYTSDSIHLNQLGAFAAGQAGLTQLASILNSDLTGPLVAQNDSYDPTYNPYGGLLGSTLWTNASTANVFAPFTAGSVKPSAGNWNMGGGGTFTGGTCVSSIVAAPDGVGYAIQTVFSGLQSASNSLNANYDQPVNAGGSTYASGDVVEAWAEVSVLAGSSQFKGVQLNIQDNNGSSVVFNSYGMILSGTYAPSGAWSGTVYAPKFTVSPYSGSGTQNLLVLLQANFDGTGAGCSATLLLSRLTLRKNFGPY